MHVVDGFEVEIIICICVKSVCKVFGAISGCASFFHIHISSRIEIVCHHGHVCRGHHNGALKIVAISRLLTVCLVLHGPALVDVWLMG